MGWSGAPVWLLRNLRKTPGILAGTGGLVGRGRRTVRRLSHHDVGVLEGDATRLAVAVLWEYNGMKAGDGVHLSKRFEKTSA